MGLGWNFSTPGRAIQTSPSTFALSSTVPPLFSTDMPTKEKDFQSFYILSLGLLNRRMLPSSAVIIHWLMPSLNSCEKRWEICERKEFSSSFLMHCHENCCPNCAYHRLAVSHTRKTPKNDK